MARPNPNAAATSDNSNPTLKPEWVKPSSDFPLWLHKGSNQLCAKFQGRPYYFGTPDHWEEGLAKYRHDWPYIIKGEAPPPMAGQVPAGATSTTDRVANLFLARERDRYTRGEISLESYDDTRRALAEWLDYFGRTKVALSIQPREFGAFRHWLQTNQGTADKPREPLGVDALDRRINYLRMMSRWASHPDNAVIPRPLRFGDEFDRVTVAEKRTARRAARRVNGKRMFPRDHVALILGHLNKEAADPKRGKFAKVMRAMFLLGLNGGYGNTDLSSLPIQAIDFDRRLIDYDRVKTGALRMVPLWKVTAEALREAIAVRPDPKEPKYAGHVFLTRTGKPWVRQTVKETPDGIEKPMRRDAVAEEFTKVLKTLGLKRKGLNFYAVRHTFYTTAGGAKDPEARKVIVGHTSEGMGEWYEQAEDEMIGRVRAVAKHVYRRLGIKQAARNPGPPTDAATASAPAAEAVPAADASGVASPPAES